MGRSVIVLRELRLDVHQPELGSADALFVCHGRKRVQSESASADWPFITPSAMVRYDPGLGPDDERKRIR